MQNIFYFIFGLLLRKEYVVMVLGNFELLGMTFNWPRLFILEWLVFPFQKDDSSAVCLDVQLAVLHLHQLAREGLCMTSLRDLVRCVG